MLLSWVFALPQPCYSTFQLMFFLKSRYQDRQMLICALMKWIVFILYVYCILSLLEVLYKWYMLTTKGNMKRRIWKYVFTLPTYTQLQIHIPFLGFVNGQEQCPVQYPRRRLIVRSLEVSKPRDWRFKLPHRFNNSQAPRQHCLSNFRAIGLF